MASKTWLITGASSGLGLAIAEAALQAGHKVIATARNPTKAADENPQSQNWATETTKKVEEAIKQAGGVIDVVINNAGYSLLGSIEDTSHKFPRPHKWKNTLEYSNRAKYICAELGLDFFLAHMQGMSESLARELSPCGIRVLLVEPGEFRTKFLSAYIEPAAGMNKGYVGTPLEKFLQVFKSKDGKQQGDPAKAAQRILEIVTNTGMGAGKEGFLRVPLGKDCYERFWAKCESMQKNLLQMKGIAHSTGYDA
ncbi:short-chain dehydrogenase, putative [Talaromyces stipitatus ATCC 10500]|uniref:Short-chain dehydrogenase, putative n=1 Tax=Talaromyces stipitatus (strain ATCC 10500 / CBS 375.48 / QM 6759 / NRRL 1006) TaxID=441959 RepID=B8MRM4_TALSN|nr:short-chain dehydrogenase, putative [Talaromyces stipitatus ATCC 10500]EED13181.1 short-chain dehydrogenase, putative [Talaromyces stipitatus ATCC 10500]